MKTVPVVRGLAALRLLRVFFGNRLEMLRRFGEATEEIAGFRFAGRSVVLVNDPALVGEVLTARAEDFHKGPGLSVFARPLLGDGLLTSEDDFHRRQRRLIAPVFLPRRVAAYADGMASLAERAQAGWTDGGEVDIAREMMRLTLAIVGRTLFGMDVREGQADDLGEALATVMRFAVDRMRAPIRLPAARLLPWQNDVAVAFARLDKTIYGLIADRRNSGETGDDLLSLLLGARDEDDGSGMTDRQIRDESMTIFLAGHETTANALAWTWYLLAQHEDVYARVQREVDDALGGRTPTYDDLARLPTTLQVLKESMRLYPPAYALVRQAIRDTEIGGWRVPNGVIVLISPYLLHRRAELFPDPERFDPDRFTPEAERSLPRHAFLPFGGGARICIGNHFALMEGQIVLAALVQRVRFTLAPGRRVPVEPEPLITLRPRNGIRLIVARRPASESSILPASSAPSADPERRPISRAPGPS